MTRLHYTLSPTEASWEEYFYHDSVQVERGYVETDDPLTVEGLLLRGFDIVGDSSPYYTSPTMVAEPDAEE